MATRTSKLTKDTPNGMVGGVCAGLADYFDIDPLLVRAIFIAGSVVSGFTVVLYLVLWIALDDTPPPPPSAEDRIVDAGSVIDTGSVTDPVAPLEQPPVADPIETQTESETRTETETQAEIQIEGEGVTRP